jgi:hypothetical protein
VSPNRTSHNLYLKWVDPLDGVDRMDRWTSVSACILSQFLGPSSNSNSMMHMVCSVLGTPREYLCIYTHLQSCFSISTPHSHTRICCQTRSILEPRILSMRTSTTRLQLTTLVQRSSAVLLPFTFSCASGSSSIISILSL